MRRRYEFVVLGYVVMPEHVHLLISEPDRGNPSIVMQAVKLGFARKVIGGEFGKKESPAHIWQRRFYDFNVWSDKKRVEKLDYMHRKPVKRGLGRGAGAMAVEQFSGLRLWGIGSGPVKRVASAQDEGAVGMRRMPVEWTGPTSRKKREKWGTPRV